jgi:hypothetical protein
MQWPLAVHAQQDGRVRRIAVLDGVAATEHDFAYQASLAHL